jgi:uncharacterized protein
MEINLELLGIQNPWWQSGKIKFDPVILSFHRQAGAKAPEWLEEIDLKEPSIQTLYGARGLGKTTGLKLLIEKLLKKGTDPKDIFYYSCRNIGTNEQLNEIIKLFLISKSDRKNRSYIFIDEISAIKNWSKGIEYLRQACKLKNVNLILSASQCERLKTASAIGQIKKNKIIHIHSRDFCGFIKDLNPRLGENVLEKNFKHFQHKLGFYLDAYLLTGGFITTINSFKRFTAIEQHIYDDYLSRLTLDIAESNRDIMLWHQILERIVTHLGRPIGHQTIARRTKAKTHLTIGEYVDIMERMFVLKTVFQGDKFGHAKKSKAKKIFFTDPFLFWLFYSHLLGSLDNWQFSRERMHDREIFDALIENIVFCHLIKQEHSNQNNENILFWRDNIKKKEINFVIKKKGGICPVLLRYDRDINDNDFLLILDAGFKKGIIVSHNKMEQRGKIKVVPLPYFLLFSEKLLK